MIDVQDLHERRVPFSGRYMLRRRLGRGGFSEVWLAEDRTARIDVALKIYTAAGGGLDEEGIAMFRSEFSVVCNMNHSSLLRPFTFDVCEGHPFLVLPYCEKGSCMKLLGKMGEQDVWQFVREVAAGLAFLHGRGIVHQDIKPDNVLLTEDGHYVITDFGISTGLRRTMRRSMRKSDTGSGTIAYMGPERFGDSPRPMMASDIWSLGATLYELITGDVPFGEQGGLMQKAGATVPKIDRAVSSRLRSLVAACLRREPWERPTAQQIAEGRWARRRIPKRAWRTAAACVIGLGFLAGTFYIYKAINSGNDGGTDAPESELAAAVAQADSLETRKREMALADSTAYEQHYAEVSQTVGEAKAGKGYNTQKLISAKQSCQKMHELVKTEAQRTKLTTLETDLDAAILKAYQYFTSQAAHFAALEAPQRAAENRQAANSLKPYVKIPKPKNPRTQKPKNLKTSEPINIKIDHHEKKDQKAEKSVSSISD